MLETDKKAFAAMMNSIAETYANRQMAKSVLRVYWAALEHLDFDEVRHGLNLHVRNPDTGMFLPKPADIIRHIDGSSDSQAKVAWSQVDKAIRYHGAWASVVFVEEPRIHAVIAEMGGWIKLCATSERDYPFKQNEFEKRYRHYLQTWPVTYPLVLVGIAEAQNAAQGLPIAAPVYIEAIAKPKPQIELKSAPHGKAVIEQKRDGNYLGKQQVGR